MSNQNLLLKANIINYNNKNNKNKGNNMNIKKVGLTALAGSLVVTSAFAGSLTLSGGAKLSYVATDGNKEVKILLVDLQWTKNLKHQVQVNLKMVLL